MDEPTSVPDQIDNSIYIASDREVERIARICHEDNRMIQEALGEEVSEPWERAPKWQRDSVIQGVRAILSGEVRSARRSHENWLMYKQNAGWKYGPVKDPDRKEHPCMVPYTMLPLEQRVKDKLFISAVLSMATALSIARKRK